MHGHAVTYVDHELAALVALRPLDVPLREGRENPFAVPGHGAEVPHQPPHEFCQAAAVAGPPPHAF